MLSEDSQTSKLELNPRGQVAPQVQVTNCDATQLGRGGRWRRSRHLRRVTRPRQAGCGTDPEMLSFPYRNRCKSPFFECSFHEITIEFLLELVQKAAEKKREQTNRQTNKQTDKQTGSGRYRARPWPCFGQSKRRYQSQMPQKLVPKTISESC